MTINTRQRSAQAEIMDDFQMEGPLLHRTLDTLARINYWLGGNRITLDGVRQLWAKIPPSHQLTLVDMGCGNGDLLRRIAKVARKEGRQVALIGIDANVHTVNYARQLSVDFPEISYQCLMIPSPKFDALRYDIGLCTLFLHHFEDEALLPLLQQITRTAALGVVVNDLHRHWLAYRLFQLVTLFIPNRMIREDGLTSILRSFRRSDLERYTQQLKSVKSYHIHWRWAFRYQWLIRTHG